jgi:hypothetical protein
MRTGQRGHARSLSLISRNDLAWCKLHPPVMGHNKRIHHHDGDEERRHHRNRELHRALHRSVFAYLTRPVADPDHPGQRISYDERDQRLRGQAYRQAVLAVERSSSCQG